MAIITTKIMGKKLVHESDELPDVSLVLWQHAIAGMWTTFFGFPHNADKSKFSVSLMDLSTGESEDSNETGVYNWAALRYTLLMSKLRSQGYEVMG